MPWSVKKMDGKYCVVHEGESKPISGGCHAVRSDAIDHMQALYASKHAYAAAEAFAEEDEEDEATLELDAEEYAIDAESEWAGNIAFEGQATGDNREFAVGAITWDELPLPLLWQKSSTDGHGGSVVIGRVDEMERREDAIFARGMLLDTPEANEYKALMEAGAAGGVSVDGDSAQYDVQEIEGEKPKIQFNAIRIRGLTAVAIPAFAGAKITLISQTTKPEEFGAAGDDCEDCHDDEHDDFATRNERRKKANKKTWRYSLTAAAPVRPPLAWFDKPSLPGPTPLTVLDDGRVFGHLALKGTCHIGMPKCTTPPMGGTYGYFHTGALETHEGVEVSVGHLTFNTGHAALEDNAQYAAAHYDHTGTVAADVIAGEDQYGIWVAGAMRPSLTEEDLRIFKAAPLSGDWRRIGSRMELVGALSVNTPGFPVPRTQVLVASGHDSTIISTIPESDYEAIGRVVYKEDLATRVETFYNQCHGEGGRFCEGPDGPGRLRDNTKKSESVVGKKSPQWMKDMLSRKRGAAAKKGASLLPKDAPQYMKDLMERKVTEGLG